MKKLLFFIALLLTGGSLRAEWYNINGTTAAVTDVINVRLHDLRPTQGVIGFDKVFYKLGRYAKDQRKMFNDYCEKNGQVGVLNWSPTSDFRVADSYSCQQKPGTDRVSMKTVVIAPNGQLYLTDGHHTINQFWHMKGGGPNLSMNVIVARDYRTLDSMDAFWAQMKVEQNVWLFDANDQPITPAELPTSFGLDNFQNDTYRGLMFFTRRIAWARPGDVTVPDAETWDDRYPTVPFTEFYWAGEIRKEVDLSQFDLTTRPGYVAAIRAVSAAVIRVKTGDVGGSHSSIQEMGQFGLFNERELFRINRPGTGKISYMLEYKGSAQGKSLAGRRVKPVDQPSVSSLPPKIESQFQSRLTR